jgi:hypothetical protein
MVDHSGRTAPPLPAGPLDFGPVAQSAGPISAETFASAAH